MFGLITRLLGGAVAPLADQVSVASARLLRKLALFFAAGACSVVVLVALTIAFDLWIAQMAGAIAGALAVAGLYFCVAAVAVFLALRDHRPKVRASGEEHATQAKAERAAADLDAQIDQFTGPLLALLQKFGLRREQLAVLAGASLAKQIGPLPLVGLAILAGFLVGRMATGWRSLVSLDTLSQVMAAFGLGSMMPADGDDEA